MSGRDARPRFVGKLRARLSGTRRRGAGPAVAADRESFLDEAFPTNGNPRKHVMWRHHRRHFSSMVTLKDTKGLEIGAFDLPLIEPEEGRCDHADFNDLDWLRATAERMEGHSARFVVPVTFDLREGYESVPRDYDWIAASHVVEHVPDVLGWLLTLAEHLKPGGFLFLTIPDKRYVFDAHRQPTTFPQVVARHRSRLRQPSYEQVFDSLYWTAPVLAHDAWAGAALAEPNRQYGLAHATAEEAELRYVDAHCSVFTPESFRHLVADLVAHDLLPFRLASLCETPENGWDFSVLLRRT